MEHHIMGHGHIFDKGAAAQSLKLITLDRASEINRKTQLLK